MILITGATGQLGTSTIDFLLKKLPPSQLAAFIRDDSNVVDAAKKAGLKRIAYTSRALKDRNTLENRLMQGHFQTEDYSFVSKVAYEIPANWAVSEPLLTITPNNY